MLIYALQSFTATDGTVCTAKSTYTLTDAAGQAAIMKGQAQRGSMPAYSAPVGLGTNQTNNAPGPLVGPDGTIYATLGTTVLTVGAGGRFATIQSALDYVATQTAFTPITVNQGTVVASAWTQGSSQITIASMTTANAYLPSLDTLRFQLAGDSTYYPVDSIKGWSAGSGVMTSAIPRIEASIGANKNISWFRENIFTILLLDPYYAESVNFPANACVSFTGNGKTLWRGVINIPAGVTSGRIDLCNIDTTGSGSTGTFISGGSTGNTIRVTGDFIGIDSEGDDWVYPTATLGNLRLTNVAFRHQPSQANGNSISGTFGGDVIIENFVWHIKPNTGVIAATSNAYLIDKIAGRNLLVRGGRVHLDDPNAGISELAVVGEASGGSNVTFGKASISNVDITCFDTSTCNFEVVCYNAIVAIPELHIDNCSIHAPNTSGTKKLVKAAANPTVASAVKIGRATGIELCDAQANITYTKAAAGVHGTATITTAASASFNHGLGYQPNIADINIVPTSLTTATSWWVSAVSATTFTITLNASGSATFEWKIGA